jgi:hypothetical protein
MNGAISSLNNAGDAVLGPSVLVNGSLSPALFTNGVLVAVNALFPPGSGWVAATADRINDGGEIAGTGQLNGVIAAFVLTPVPPVTYTIRNVCDFSCTGTLLSNSGSVVVFEQFPAQPQMAVNSPLHGVTAIPSSVKVVNAINDVGVIAGADMSARAIVSAPPYSAIENLNSVFGWGAGSAMGINDGGDILGFGIPATHVPLFSRLSILNLNQINNSGAITGSYLDRARNTHYFLFSPLGGVSQLGGRPVALSNVGHVLIQNAAGGYGIQSAGSVVPLPAGYTWKALNDLDEVVGDAADTADPNRAFLYSVSRGLVQLSTGLVPSGFYLSSAVAINDSGEILVSVQVANQSSGTSALLVPGNPQ